MNDFVHDGSNLCSENRCYVSVGGLGGDLFSVVSRAPQAPRLRGARGAEGARQEEVVAVTPWPGAQTSCVGGGPENRR